MSNTERQRQFRERNPGYYQRLHAKRKAQVQALCEQLLRDKAIAEIMTPAMPLCLPAPEQVTQPWVEQLLRNVESRDRQPVSV